MSYSNARTMAMLRKEFLQMSRDQFTFAMIIIIPLIEIVLFGFALNANPRHLPTAVVTADHSVFSRRLVQAMNNTNYFAIQNKPTTVREANLALQQGKVLFVLRIPPHFQRRLVRGEHPSVLLEGDTTDPLGVVNAIAAIAPLPAHVMDPVLRGPLSDQRASSAPFQLLTHAKYNPENITQYLIVPGLIGLILTMTMVMITSCAITRERERGTMESLLSTPVRPIEVMIGKVLPYVMVGYIQICTTLFLGRLFFSIPFVGQISTLMIAAFPFIAANLAVGLFFSSISKNQLQAVQMAVFFYLPSILLSGFMFPFAGMPIWARMLGEGLPLTHFLRIVRGIMLKGSDWSVIYPELWPIVAFAVLALILGVTRYRQTLD